MTLREAYDKWGQQKGVETFCAKTRSVFQRTWKLLNWDTPCKQLTLTVLTDAARRSKVFRNDAIKAASVMVHVLNYAHQQEPKEQPKPNFSYSDIMEESHEDPVKKAKNAVTAEKPVEQKKDKIEQKLPKSDRKVLKSEQKLPKITQKFPDMKTEKDTLGRSKNRKKRRVAQIDPKTLQVVKVWDSMGQAESTLKIRNVTRAIEKRRCAGGFFWCDEKDIKTFTPKKDARGNNSVPTSHMTVKNAAVIEEKIDVGHGHPTPGKQAPAAEQPAEQPTKDPIEEAQEALNSAKTLHDFDDHELIDELIERKWHGALNILHGKKTIKVEF